MAAKAKKKVVKKVTKKAAKKPAKKPKVATPKFKKASELCSWVAEKLTPANWCQGYLAGYYVPNQFFPEDEWDFKPVTVKNPNAETFCSLGWIEKCNQGFENEAKAGLVAAIEGDSIAEVFTDGNWIDDAPIINFNDAQYTKIKQVKSKFLKASKILAKWEAAGKPLPKEEEEEE